MKMHTMLAFVAAATLSLSAQAHDCSGGAAGGMDATGNQCNGDTIVLSDTTLASPAAGEARAAAPATPHAIATSGRRSHHTAAAHHTASRKQRGDAV
jgi:hypothetical protein